MTSAANVVPAARSPERAPRSLRTRALVRLLDARIRARLGAQLAKVFAVLAGVGYGIAVPFASRAASGDASLGVVRSAVEALAWVAGGAIALSVAGRATSDADRAVVQLARQRGFSTRAIAWAELLAPGRRALRVVGAPAVLVAVLSLAFARDLATLLARLVLVLGVALFAVALALAVALLVSLSRALSGGRSRLVLLALVLVPEVLRTFVPSLPSVPSLLGALLDQVIAIGGGR